jgi:predicted flap endonuclease-1-like 5' DNA nuclease
MPEITAVHFAIFALLFTAGAVLGWVMRGDRCARERIAVNAEWHERVEAQEEEHARLAELNKDLMQAISHHQAAQKDTAQRSRELSQSLKDAIERRDELQRQIKDTRSNLEVALRQRDQLQTDIQGGEARGETTIYALREKDNKIFRLSRELTSWQNRLPPLVDRFRQRNQEALALRAKLETAEQRIAELESQLALEPARSESSNANEFRDGLDASNDQYEDNADVDLSDLKDQIVDDSPEQGYSANNSTEYSDDFDYLTDHATIKHAPAHAGYDDLQQIKGVGPAIEQTLNELGIYRFAQIAEISEYDINRIAERLNGFRSRIYREDWIGQARTLYDLRQTDPA